MRCGVIAIVDGVNYKTFKKLLKRGKLPFVEEISKEGYFIEKCYTVFPSATVSGHASINAAEQLDRRFDESKRLTSSNKNRVRDGKRARVENFQRRSDKERC
ncbi:alkaline phosphatase family protein [Ferroglobus placidus]|uniref:alkaline phosphatase family protein n=1 Tax=Ferroglobus placidus TaxID=54261 RepID=UPI00145CFDE1|nr:alkaline phosphatase family protein [Ferroglobus placidus]